MPKRKNTKTERSEELTPKQQAAFMADPSVCPFCGSDEIDDAMVPDGNTPDIQNSYSWCDTCHATWVGVYKLERVINAIRGGAYAKTSACKHALRDINYLLMHAFDTDIHTCEIGHIKGTIKELIATVKEHEPDWEPPPSRS